jgi:hypothetical protein
LLVFINPAKECIEVVLSPYELALIAGGFTVVGALITIFGAHHLAIHLESIKRKQFGVAKLRSAFAPALAMIYLARHHGTHNTPDDDEFIKKALLDHATAIEEFRIFVPESKQTAYQEAWEAYRKDALQDIFDRTGDEWSQAAHEDREVPHGKIIEERINAILAFANT